MFKGKPDESTTWVSAAVSPVLWRRGIFLVLTLAMLSPPGWGQRIGPLVLEEQRRSKVEAVRPPSLRLSLPLPATATLPPLGPDDLQRLQTQRGQPPVIGVHRQLPPGAVRLNFSGETVKTTAEGAWQSTSAGPVWRLKVSSPSARAMRIHFQDFAVGAGRLWLHSESGQIVGPYSGSGQYGDGDFWSGIVFGDSLTIEYLPGEPAADEAVPFQIVAISHIWDDAFGTGVETAANSDRPEWEKRLFAGPIEAAAGTGSGSSLLDKPKQPVKRSTSLETPRAKAARRLTPGRPVEFRIGPVENPTIFTGDNSFRLEVPDNATQVTFTLESADSEVDVDLYVRYGEDNEVQDGRVVYDYASRGDTGDEEIVITPDSDPQLQAGAYFVSVLLYDTGVTAECTLTAEVERDDDGEDPEPIGGGPLTPGQPSDFRLGPVDNPTLFAGNRSFRLEVPEAATLVTLVLESDADVALVLRHGEDNGIQDGRLVFDHGSRDPSGDERIGITRRSDPPLRAGTYFVSIVVFDTGAVAEGTITATVDTDAVDCHLDVTCHSEWASAATGVARIFIETSEGRTRACSGTVLNNSRQDFTPFFLTAAHCVQTEAEARSVTAAWFYQTRTCNGEPPDIRSVPRTEGARLLATTGHSEIGQPEGDMTLLRLEGDLPDGVMFQGWDADPQPVGAQVAGIHHPASDWGEFKRISFGEAIPDPGFGFSDDTYLNVSYPLGQGYTEGGSSGSAIFGSPGTLVGALSGGDVGSACPTRPSRDIYTRFSAFYPQIRQFIDEDFALEFAHFANGSSISSDVVLLNVAATPIRPTLYFADDEGNRIDAGSLVEITRDLEVLENGALSVRTEMAPLEELTISTHGRGDLVVGSVRVTADGSIGGVLRFDAPGIGVAGVGASEPLNDALFPARRQAGGVNTGVALRNLESDGMTVSCSLMRRGSVLEDEEIQLDAGGQTAQFINEIFPGVNTSDFVGSVRCTAPEGRRFAGIALEMDANDGIFTTLPVVAVDQTGAGNGETSLEFAHFANGSSITSDVVLLNVSTQRIRPTLYFFDQDGNGIEPDSVVDTGNSLEIRPDGGLRARQALPPLGDLTISTHGRGDVVVGSVRVISDGPIGGVLRFTLPGAGVAGVGASEPVADALFPARRQAGGINTGVALRNLTAEEMTVSCNLMRGGSALESVDIPLDAGGQTARFIDEIFAGAGTSEFVGSVRCLAPVGGRFAGVALEMDFDNGIFTTLPVVPVKGGTRPEVPRTAPTVSLSASPTSIERGQSATLRWSSTNATSASLTPGIGTVPTSGSRRVSPTRTTTYRITVRGADGQTASDSTTVTVTEPPASLAPADQDAFNEVFVGKRMLTSYPDYHIDFIRPGRFEETEESDVYPGDYTYRNSGSNTGTLTLNYDDGDRCTFELTFASETSGTFTYSCIDGESGNASWRLADIPSDDEDDDTSQVCAAGSTIQSGSECALQFPEGTPDAGNTFGRFAVGEFFGSEKGCLFISSGFQSCGSSNVSLPADSVLNTPSGNKYSIVFSANMIEDSSSWTISELSITQEE
ncbi:MAG: PPC domain-containing protein [Acidobacteriota bacterium]|nr:PPC domain-containing protein [Acidobacteriota bacterium]